MIESDSSSGSSVSEHKLPPWTDNVAPIHKHPELHHYTTRGGLEGIWTTNTLWATHFSTLSDSSEVKLLKYPLIGALEPPIRRYLIDKQRNSLRTRRLIEKQGGVSKVTKGLARDFVEAHVATAFTGGNVSALAEPFICSFCSYANDNEYEKTNGLLSQWRGYGGHGRFAIVFDTRQLDSHLAREWRAHFWVKLELAEVVYLEGPETLERAFPDLIDGAVAMISDMIDGSKSPREKFIEPFFQAATLLKHRGFREEREVRIVAIPQSRRALADRGHEDRLIGWPPVKQVHAPGGSKKHVDLFEALCTDLPIKRIIVGPGANQKEDIEFARSVVSGRVPIDVSETPFIG